MDILYTSISVLVSLLILAVLIFLRHKGFMYLAGKMGLTVKHKDVFSGTFGSKSCSFGWRQVDISENPGSYGLVHIGMLVVNLSMLLLVASLLNNATILSLDGLTNLLDKLSGHKQTFLSWFSTKLFAWLFLLVIIDIIESLIITLYVLYSSAMDRLQKALGDNDTIYLEISYPYLFAFLFLLLAVILLVVLRI